MTGLHDLTTTLAELHEVQRDSWTQESATEHELIERLERELAAATEEARAERARTRAELHDARARFLSMFRRT